MKKLVCYLAQKHNLSFESREQYADWKQHVKQKLEEKNKGKGIYLLTYSPITLYKNYVKKLQNGESTKVPKGKYISIEIECIFPGYRSLYAMKKALAIYCVKNSGVHVEVKGDGSISYDEDEGERGIEVVLSVPANAYGMHIKNVCKILNSWRVRVNKSCGLHAHFDMRKLPYNTALRYARNIGRQVHLLFQIVPQSRRDNEYCTNEIVSERDGSRYAVVNMTAYDRHSTIEVRLHSGTTNPTKIINWIEVLDLLMHTPLRSECKTWEELLEKINASDELCSYVLSRRTELTASCGDDDEDTGLPAPRDDDDDSACELSDGE